MKIRVADYIAKVISEKTDFVFLVTGGSSMHLNDAFGRVKGLTYISCHNEQACSMAAEAYTRVSGKIGAVNVTTGPGGINALNGVFGAWVDSIPMIIISGQVKRETSMDYYQLTGKLRQLGDQEVDIICMVKGITKYSVLIDDPKTIKYHLKKALFLATNGRPGPCWIDVPNDVQSSIIEENEMFDFSEDEKPINESISKTSLNTAIEIAIKKILASKRPVLYAGSGIWHSKTYDKFLKFTDLLKIPVVTAWNSNDLLWDEHPYYAGRPGSVGNRAGNFTVQNSDCLLVLGCRLNIRLVSYNWMSFAQRAFKIGVDIDSNELNKPTCNFDMKLTMDLREFFPIAIDMLSNIKIQGSHDEWIRKSKYWLTKYPICLPEYWENKTSVNPYCFIDVLFDKLNEDEIIVCSNGTACVTAFQGAKIKKGQRLFHNSGCASMGYELPAAIGAAMATGKKKRIICLAGDGSIMMNLQELQTIIGNMLPVKIFLLNNKGYHSIRQTQNNFFKDNIVGCGMDSGLSFPDFENISKAFAFKYNRIENNSQLEGGINISLANMDASVTEILVDLNQSFSPKLSSKILEDGKMVTSSLEDMYPFLDAKEMRENILLD